MKNLLVLFNVLLLLVTGTLLFLDVSNVFVSAFSLVVTVVILITFKIAHGNILSLGIAFISYNLLMHFGFGIIHFLISDQLAKEAYAGWVLTFLKSNNYALAVIISALAFEGYTIAWLLGLKKESANTMEVLPSQADNERREQSVCYTVGMLMLGGTFLYFIYLLLIGRLSLSMTYIEYRENVMAGNGLYSWMMVFYATGLLYVVASSEGKKRNWGITLFALTAVILLLTGNKGEVFYAVLAALGVLGYQKKKLSKKLVALICVILFIIIPVVTSARSTGVSGSFTLEFSSITDPFLEIGMQIRCVVFSLDRMAKGFYEFMYGYSYLKPICNILSYLIFPLSYMPDIPIDLTSSRSFFYGYGFSPVAEGYLNFGIFGSVLFFAVIGYFIGKLEFKRMNPTTLCLVGSILTVLINSSRNVFYFVPGQVMVMVMLYFAVKWMSTSTTRSRV